MLCNSIQAAYTSFGTSFVEMRYNWHLTNSSVCSYYFHLHTVMISLVGSFKTQAKDNHSPQGSTFCDKRRNVVVRIKFSAFFGLSQNEKSRYLHHLPNPKNNKNLFIFVSHLLDTVLMVSRGESVTGSQLTTMKRYNFVFFFEWICSFARSTWKLNFGKAYSQEF